MSYEENYLLRRAAVLGFTLVINRNEELPFLLFRCDKMVFRAETTQACCYWLNGVAHEREHVNAKG